MEHLRAGWFGFSSSYTQPFCSMAQRQEEKHSQVQKVYLYPVLVFPPLCLNPLC